MNSRIRLLFQMLILILVVWVIANALDLETYCPMGGILAFGTKLNQGTMPCNMSSVAVFMALGLLVGALAIGKLFCSFICPIGFLTEWVGKIGKKFKIQFRIPHIGDRLLRSIKYFLLFIVVYFTVTSSELFCRKFDPYFGAGTGFGADTILLWSIGAVVITVLGAIFVKQFWCRYLCFLGAASNIFVNIWGAVIVAVIYFGLMLIGIKLSVIWFIGGLAVVGFLIEAGFLKSFILPIMKITVNQDTCTKCDLCTKACPYDIQVHHFKKVNHPDCVMCNECITACKKEKAVGINGSFNLRFLPPILVIALISMGFILSANFEFKTLEQRWGKFDRLETPAIYQQSGIKNVKCWGSSMALYNVLKTKKGIYGLDTYAASHTVTVYFDPAEISENDVKSALFNPNRYKTNTFKDYAPDSLTIWEVGIQNLFDTVDQINLSRALHLNKFIFGFESIYGEPVLTKIFFDADSTNVLAIKQTIEIDQIKTEIAGKETQLKLNFKCDGAGVIIGKIDMLTFARRLFSGMDRKFNDYNQFDEQTLHIYEIGLPEAENILLRQKTQYLVSHLSVDENIVRYKTLFTDRPVAHIYFHPDFVDTATIHRLLMMDSLIYFTSDTTTDKTPNIFKFEYPGREMSASEVVDLVKGQK